MNPLTHAYFALELFKDQDLTQDQKDHLIVGSILPDIHITGLIHFQKTHQCGLDFFHYAKNPLHKYLALGIISHGEEPKGLDYYTHNGKGYIQQKHNLVLPLAQKYKLHLGGIDDMTVHHLIEFSVENLVAEKEPSIVHQVLSAFKNPKIEFAITSFSIFLDFSEEKNRKIISLFNNRNLLDYFHNFSDPETTSQNWLNYTFYRNLKKGKNLPFREKFKKMTKFTFYNLKQKISDKHITCLLHELNSLLREDIHNFLENTQQEIIPLKNELLSYLDTQRS